MVGLSSEWIRKHWRYAVQEEFHRVPEDAGAPPGDEATWADGHPLIFPRGEAGGAAGFLKFGDEYDDWADYSLNCDSTRFAVILRANRNPHGETALHLYHLSSGDRTELRVHDGSISGVIFSPTDPNLLILSMSPRPGGGSDVKEQIVLLDISKDLPASQALSEEQLGAASETAVGAMVLLRLSPDEQEVMRTQIRGALGKIVAARRFADLPMLHGRLCNSFNAESISHDGRYMIYQPGERPRSNGRDDRWILRVYDLHSHSDTINLKGHTDAIMWVGWSPADKWIMSICWDRTVRIWDARTGEEKWQWRTPNQNWTGSFGPAENDWEASWVIATSGDGVVHCWSLFNGEKLWEHQYLPPGRGHAWTRAVAISPTGRYVAVGGEEAAMVNILDQDREKGEHGRLEAVTKRILGRGGLEAPDDDDSDEEKEANEEKRQAADNRWTRLIMSMFNVRQVEFIDEHRFVWSGYPDGGVHMYDIRDNRMYRWAPEPPPIPKEGGDWEVPVSCLGFEICEEEGEKVVWTVHGDGLRKWTLPAVLDESIYEFL